MGAAWRGVCSCQGCGRVASSQVATVPSPRWAGEVLWGWICSGNPWPARFGSHLCCGLLAWGVGRIGLIALGIQLCPEFLRQFAAGRPHKKGEEPLKGTLSQRTLSPGIERSSKWGACVSTSFSSYVSESHWQTRRPAPVPGPGLRQVASWIHWFLGDYKGIGFQRLSS